MLRLKGQTQSGEWVEFWVHDIVLPSIDLSSVWVSGEIGTDVLTATIQPADDSRKAMLDEIRSRIRDFGENNEYVLVANVNAILDEAEVKL